MAALMKRMTEYARQTMHLEEGKAKFKPVPNARNPSMLVEVDDFARVVRAYKRVLKGYAENIDAYLDTQLVVFQKNLPRVWTSPEDHPGLCEPGRSPLSSEHPSRIGGDFDMDMLKDNLMILQRRIDGIVSPIDNWLRSLAVVKARMARLDKLKLTVDARRRAIMHRYADTLDRVEIQRTAAGVQAQQGALWAGTEEDEDASDRLSSSKQLAESNKQMKALHKQRKLDAVTMTYQEQERMIHEQLSALATDSVYFKSYIAAGLLVIKEALQGCLSGIGPARLPLHGYSLKECNAERYGAVGTVEHLMAATPKALEELSADSNESEDNGEVQMHPSERTAHPLKVAACAVTPHYTPMKSPTSNRSADATALTQSAGAGSSVTDAPSYKDVASHR